MPQVMNVKRIQYKPPLGGSGGPGRKGAVCRYWLQGRCNRNPCRFVHGEVPKPNNYTYHRNAHPYQQTSYQPSHAARPNSKKPSVLKSGGGGTTNNRDGTLTKNLLPEPKQSLSLKSVGYGMKASGTAKLPHKNSDPEPQVSSFLTSTGDAIPQEDTQQSMILGTCNNGDKHENSDPEPQDSSFMTTTVDAISLKDTQQSMIPGTRDNGTMHKNSDPEPQEPSILTSSGDAISQKDTQQSMILETGNNGNKHENSDREPQASLYLTSSGDAISQKETQQSMILGASNNGDKHENCDPEPQESSSLTSSGDAISQKETQQSMIEQTCNNGDKDQCSNSWFMGVGVSKIAELEGHNKAVTGIALPQGSDKLCTGSGDGDFRVWDCHTGKCVTELNLGSEIGCFISDGPWIFAGLRNLVKVWNTQTSTEYSLEGPVGQVSALETSDKDMLFAGMQDGSILVWRYNPETNAFQFVTTLEGHSCGVLSLKVGARSLYSGSMDNTIRKWDLDTLQCAQTLTGHTAAVTSLLCWDKYLLSCSLDQTIKAWGYSKNGCVEAMHTHKEEHAVLALFGMHDADKKPILFCSCSDNSVHLYELPLFRVRGKIYGKQQVRRMESGPGGQFFTSDGAGGVAVWNWLSQAQTAEKVNKL